MEWIVVKEWRKEEEIPLHLLSWSQEQKNEKRNGQSVVFLMSHGRYYLDRPRQRKSRFIFVRRDYTRELKNTQWINASFHGAREIPLYGNKSD